MLVADGGSQIRVGGAGAAPPPSSASTSSPSSYAADWNPPSAAARSTAGAAWPQPGRAIAGGPVFDRSPTPSPSPGPAPQAPSTPSAAEIAAKTAAQAKALGTAKIDASLAQDVYKDPPNPPAGYHVADDSQLARLGVTPQMLDDGRSDFRARVYVGDDGRTVVAYRGSLSREDWKNDIQQGAGFHSDYYDRAIDVGQRVARSGQDVTFTGHSLGGGLASASAVASGRPADTFNAAGITTGTIAHARSANVAAGAGGKAGHVDAYYDGGDPLSKFQDANAFEGGLIGGLLGGGLPGVFIGAVAGHTPSAYGERHVLATIDPPGGGSITDRHGMDYVQRGLDRAIGALH